MISAGKHPCSRSGGLESAVLRGAKNVALAGEDEVRVNRELEIDEARFEKVYRAPGIDRPDYALGLQRLDAFYAAAVENRIGPMRDEGSVEIKNCEFIQCLHPLCYVTR